MEAKAEKMGKGAVAGETKVSDTERPRDPGFKLGSAEGPMIYFDFASNSSTNDGIISVTLIARRAYPATERVRIDSDYVVVGYLRCGLEAARNLRDSVDKALLVAAEAKGVA